MRVDEAGHDVRAGGVECLRAIVRAEPGDHAVADRDIDVQPFACEDRQHPAAADDKVGGLVPPGHRQAASEITRRRHQFSLLASIGQV